MIVPAAMWIESAVDGVASLPQWLRDDQKKELLDALPAASDQMQRGYELGLQTMRVLLKADPKAQEAGVDL
jgi:hypothetical protein